VGFAFRQPPQVWCEIRDHVVGSEESSMVRESATQSYRAGGARNGFTLIELLVVVAIIGLLLGLLFPAVQAVREKTRGNSCSGNLRQLATAMHSYHNVNGRLPMGADCTYDQVIAHCHTWVEYLFPFINQQAVFDKIDFGVSNHLGPNPAALNGLLIPSLLCPSDPKAGLFNNVRKWQYTPGGAGTFSMGESYAPSGGPLSMNWCPIPAMTPNINCLSHRGGARPSHPPRRPLGGPGMFVAGPIAYGFDHCTDGLSNTFLIGETLPQYNDFMMYFVTTSNVATTNVLPNTAAAAHATCTWECYAPTGGFNSRHPGGVQVMMADGSSRWVGDGIDYRLYQFLGNRKDGQIASLDGQ
jgi:prepilin-type N-terminal cleavage/methylation domain-containing protein/prepilin-type processing-associated H-X9-DG protein